METEKKEVKKWYRRVWEHLTRRQQGSAVAWWPRALIVLAAVLTGFSLWVLPTTYAITHQTFMWCMMGFTVLIAVRFAYKTRRRTPDQDDHLLEAIVGHVYRNWSPNPGNTRRVVTRWRRFLLTNLLIAAVVSSYWWYAWIGNWASQHDWVAIGKAAFEIVEFLVLVGIGCAVLWLAWKGMRRIKYTFGRREPYEQAIWKWKRALEDEQRAHAQLREAQKVSGVGIATAIALLRAVPKHRGDAQIGQAKHALQEALHGLIPDDTLRDAMLERARRVAEGEDQAQPSTATPSPTA